MMSPTAYTVVAVHSGYAGTNVPVARLIGTVDMVNVPVAGLALDRVLTVIVPAPVLTEITGYAPFRKVLVVANTIFDPTGMLAAVKVVEVVIITSSSLAATDVTVPLKAGFVAVPVGSENTCMLKPLPRQMHT